MMRQRGVPANRSVHPRTALLYLFPAVKENDGLTKTAWIYAAEFILAASHISRSSRKQKQT